MEKMNLVKKKHLGLVPPIEDLCECSQEAIVYVSYAKKNFCDKCYKEFLGVIWLK